MMRKFESIDDLKAVAEFFPRGKIIPRRILKAPRRYSSKVRFGSDCWVLNTPKGHVCATEDTQGCAVRIGSYIKNAEFVGSPYTVGGSTWFVQKGNLPDNKWLEILNERLNERNE